MPPSLNGLSILIVENEFLLAINLESIVRDAGAGSVRLAASLADARKVVDEGTFDAAILDIRLMDGDSLPLAQELIASGVNVVIHSGHAHLGHAEIVPEAYFLPKPSTPAEIVQAVLKSNGVPGSFALADMEVSGAGSH